MEFATIDGRSVRLALIDTGLATKNSAPVVLRATDGSQLIKLTDAQKSALEARGFTFKTVGKVVLADGAIGGDFMRYAIGR